MKLGTNNIEVILCVISECGLRAPFCLVVPMLIINRNMDHTAFCTILESFGGKRCGHGMCLTGLYCAEYVMTVQNVEQSSISSSTLACTRSVPPSGPDLKVGPIICYDC